MLQRFERATILSLALFVIMQFQSAAAETFETLTGDGVTIYGETYFGDLPESAPLVMLFHQGRSNGRGEYAPIASWLNANGFRAIAVDQRSGGDLYGGENRTVAGLTAGSEPAYCKALPDLEATLELALNDLTSGPVIVWGSSYSGSLVFKLAAHHPDGIAGVIAFSPAGSSQLDGCRAEEYASDLKAAAFALRPESEMANPATQEQLALLGEKGVRTEVVENGVHGSSMLVDERTGEDMSDLRQTVLDWLRGVSVAD